VIKQNLPKPAVVPLVVTPGVPSDGIVPSVETLPVETPGVPAVGTMPVVAGTVPVNATTLHYRSEWKQKFTVNVKSKGLSTFKNSVIEYAHG